MADLLQTVQEKMAINTNRTCFVCQSRSFSDVLEGPDTEPTGPGFAEWCKELDTLMAVEEELPIHTIALDALVVGGKAANISAEDMIAFCKFIVVG